MHRMNDQSGNALTQLFAWLAALSAALGLSTQDFVFMIFGLIGVVLSLASFISGRLDAHKLHKEDEKRTRLLEKYFEDVRKLPQEQRPSSVKVVTDAINRISANAK
ncbi:hypothetical protein [Enterobacter pseudoroggenkampii]|uniref:hypothetical protein n=1 Tax=Enterobacter pseudoroggenkampii TaxID=2996112 RepID=UPI0038A7F1EE